MFNMEPQNFSLVDGWREDKNKEQTTLISMGVRHEMKLCGDCVMIDLVAIYISLGGCYSIYVIECGF